MEYCEDVEYFHCIHNLLKSTFINIEIKEMRNITYVMESKKVNPTTSTIHQYRREEEDSKSTTFSGNIIIVRLLLNMRTFDT